MDIIVSIGFSYLNNEGIYVCIKLFFNRVIVILVVLFIFFLIEMLEG